MGRPVLRQQEDGFKCERGGCPTARGRWQVRCRRFRCQHRRRVRCAQAVVQVLWRGSPSEGSPALVSTDPRRSCACAGGFLFQRGFRNRVYETSPLPCACGRGLPAARRTRLQRQDRRRPVARRRYGRGAETDPDRPVRGGAGRAPPAGRRPQGQCRCRVPDRPRDGRGGGEARPFRRRAGRAAGRGHRRLPRHAGRASRAPSRPARACPRLLPQGPRTGWRGVISSRCWPASRRPGSRSTFNRFLGEIRARKRWSDAPRHGARARHQYRRRLGRADHLHPRPAVPPQPGGADHLGHRRLGLGGRRIPVPAGRPRNGVRGKPLAAARRRRHLAAGSTGRARSTG